MLPRRSSPAPWLVFLLALLFAQTARAVFIDFENCLPTSYRLADPLPLQWVPLRADARLDTSSENYRLVMTVWGNVTGSRNLGVELPPPGDPAWEDPKKTDGKILDVPDRNGERPSLTTLVARVDFLSYQAYREREDFCNNKLTNDTCPLAPVFDSVDL